MGGLNLSWDLKPGAATTDRIVVRKKLKQYAAMKAAPFPDLSSAFVEAVVDQYRQLFVPPAWTEPSETREPRWPVPPEQLEDE